MENLAVESTSEMSDGFDILQDPKINNDGSVRKNNDHLFTDGAKINVPFPDGENLTAVEIVTFFTNWLREHDPVFRLASNGASNSIITDIINYHRRHNKPGDVMNNTVCKLTQTAMRFVKKYKYIVMKTNDKGKQVPKEELWSINHHNRSNTKDHYGKWDPNSLAVGNVHYGNQNRNRHLESVLFTELADGVEDFPSLENGDGLDLTRAVKFAQEHKEKKYMFPEHFSEILKHIGRTPVQDKHRDGPTFARWVKKRKDEQQALRKARASAPPSQVPKATSGRVSKAGATNRKEKHAKLVEKIKEAMDHGRLDLGPDGQLVLFDKPMVKPESVDSAAGIRQHASAHSSPVGEGGHDSSANGEHVLTASQAADPHRRGQATAQARRAQAARAHRQSQAANTHHPPQPQTSRGRSEAAASRRRHKISTRNAMAGSNANGVLTQNSSAVDDQQGPAPTFYEYSGVNVSFSASGQHDGAQNLMQTFNDVWNGRKPAGQHEIIYHENIFPNAPAPNGYTQSNVGREVPPLRFYPPANGTNVAASYQEYVDSANDTAVENDDIDPSFFASHSPLTPTGEVDEDNVDASIPLGDAAMYQNVDPAYFDQDSVDDEPALGWQEPPTQSAEGAQYWASAVYRGEVNDNFDPAILRP